MYSKCVVQQYVSLFKRVHALQKLFSIEACSFLPQSSCTSSDLPFFLNFCHLGLLINTFHLLRLRAWTGFDFWLLPFIVFSFPSLRFFAIEAALFPWAFSGLAQSWNQHFFPEHGNLQGIFLESTLKTKVGLIKMGSFFIYLFVYKTVAGLEIFFFAVLTHSPVDWVTLSLYPSVK